MSDISVSVLVDRSEMAMADLQLNTPGHVTTGYKIIRDTLGPGEMQWRRITADSPWVEGRGLVHAVKESPTAVLGVRVLGNTQAQLVTNVNALVQALSQFSYDMTVSLEGQTAGVWRCEPADYVIGEAGIIQVFHMKARQQEVRFVIPRDPTPTGGFL